MLAKVQSIDCFQVAAIPEVPEVDIMWLIREETASGITSQIVMLKILVSGAFWILILISCSIKKFKSNKWNQNNPVNRLLLMSKISWMKILNRKI